MARPTKSRALYAQMAGRGTRPLGGLVDPYEDADARKQAIGQSDKPHLEVIDFVGNAGRHKLITTADLLGGRYDDAVVSRAKQKAEEAEGEPVDMEDALADAEREIAEEEARRRRARVRLAANYTTSIINPFDVFQVRPWQERGWDKGKEPSEKMLAMLEKNGIPTKGLSYSQAHQLCGQLVTRWKTKQCTFKQAALLQRFGYAGDVSFREAGVLIDRIAKNGWKRPDPVEDVA